MLCPASSCVLRRQSPGPALLLLLLALVTTGCGASRTTVETVHAEHGLAATTLDQRLRAEVATWEGTPHRLGGTSRRGVDCSGLVMVLYENLFDIHLPRTTEGQVHAGVGLDKQDLQPGDLVFFRPSKTRHVGIYLSGGEFAHASSSEGVMVSRLDESYWQETYWTARRVLRPKTTAPLAADEQDRVSPPSAPSPVRSSTGW